MHGQFLSLILVTLSSQISSFVPDFISFQSCPWISILDNWRIFPLKHKCPWGLKELVIIGHNFLLRIQRYHQNFDSFYLFLHPWYVIIISKITWWLLGLHISHSYSSQGKIQISKAFFLRRYTFYLQKNPFSPNIHLYVTD